MPSITQPRCVTFASVAVAVLVCLHSPRILVRPLEPLIERVIDTYTTALMVAPGCFGGWESQNPTDVCAAITHVSSEMWRRNPAECDALIRRRSLAHMMLVLIVGAGFVVYQLIGCAIQIMYFQWFVTTMNVDRHKMVCN